jgi:hypothetical protein
MSATNMGRHGVYVDGPLAAQRRGRSQGGQILLFGCLFTRPPDDDNNVDIPEEIMERLFLW